MEGRQRADQALRGTGTVIDQQNACVLTRFGGGRRERIAEAVFARRGDAHAQFIRDRLQPHETAHAREQGRILDRLGQKIVRPGIEPLEAIARLVERRHHHDGDMGRRRRGLESAAGLETVHAVHHHVQQDEIAQALLADGNGIGTVGRRDDVEIFRRELHLEKLHVRGHVVDDQDASGHDTQYLVTACAAAQGRA